VSCGLLVDGSFYQFRDSLAQQKIKLITATALQQTTRITIVFVMHHLDSAVNVNPTRECSRSGVWISPSDGPVDEPTDGESIADDQRGALSEDDQ
jgi:ABC-type thiamine transport system ATPase subunit